MRFDAGTDANGKRRQESVTVRGTKKQAQAELNRILHELRTGEYVDANRMTLAQYLGRWLSDYARSNVSAKTYERYSEIALRHLVPALGHRKLADLKPLHIQGYYTEALAGGRLDGRGGLSPQTVLHHHRVLRQALRQAVRWQLLVRNPAESVEPPRPEEREPEVYTLAESAVLERLLAGHRFAPALLFQLATGLRRGEVLALQWDDLDLDRGVAQVRRSLEQTQEFGLRFKAPKTKRSRRSVVLPGFLVTELRVHRGAQAQERLLAGPLWHDQGLVFCDPSGGPIKPRRFSQVWGELTARHPELKHLRLHDLRHTHATHLLQEGVHPKIVSERLGHANIGITLDTYSHVIPGMQEDAAAQYDRAFRAARDQAAR